MKKFPLTTEVSELLRNNSGQSIKSWFLYGTFILGALILLSTVLVMVIDVIHDGKVDSSMSDLSQVILAVSAMYTAGGLPKIVGEIFERSNKKQDKE